MKYRLMYLVLWMLCASVVAATAGQKVWQPLPPLPFGGTISNVAVNENGVLYISTGDYVYRSTDNGATWIQVGANRIWGGVTDIATFPGQPNVVIVSTSTGIYWSMNGGQSWYWDRFEVNPHTGAGGGVGSVHAHEETGRVFAGPYLMNLSGGWQRTHPDKYTFSYAFLSDGTVLALTGNYTDASVLRTGDGGLSWTETATLSGLGQMFVDSSDRVYAFTEHYEIVNNEVIRSYPVYTSADKGSTWTEFTVGTAGLPGTNPRVELLGIDPATNDVYAKLHDPTNFYGRGVYVSTDVMQSWTLLDPALEQVRTHEIAFLPEGGIMLATDADGILHYTPSQTPRVQSRTDNVPSTDALTLFATRSGRLFATSNANRTRYTDDEGTTWHSFAFGDQGLAARTMFELPDGTLLLGAIATAASGGNPLYRSTDNGTTWQAFGTGLSRDSVSWTAVRSLFTDDHGRLYASVEYSSQNMLAPFVLMVSNDNGATWSTIPGEFGTTVVTTDGVIFTAGLTDQFEPFFKRSADGGTTWTTVESPRSAGISSQPELAVDRVGRVYFRLHSGDTMFVSSDNGTTWQAFDGEPYSRVYIDNTGNSFFVYSAAMVYLMEYGATEKTRIITGLPTPGAEEHHVVSIAFGRDNTPYLAHGNGRLYKLTDGTASDVPLPSDAGALHSTAWPNPFADRLSIGFTLHEAASVRLRLFDILGSEVRTIDAGRQGAGSGTLTIDGGGLAPGMYTYQLIAGNTVYSGVVVRR